MKYPTLIPLVAALAVSAAAGAADTANMAKIPGDSYRPLYLKKDTPLIPVKAFLLDKTAVTNRQFAEFVKRHPEWQRDKVRKRHAETDKYLRHWVKNGSGYAPKSSDLNKPVTHVSWFAANAYCTEQGKRLPTIDEWEYAGMASALKKNGTEDAEYKRTILEWYADGGKRPLGEVGKGRPNYWGVHDMHGMIWEWTEDFNSSLLNGGSGDTKDMFCGGGSANSTDPTNYAAFLRFGIRLSLKPNYVLRNLGFRCAVSQ